MYGDDADQNEMTAEAEAAMLRAEREIEQREAREREADLQWLVTRDEWHGEQIRKR